jgi:[acyl-carrier-protein] S-malonyltransferase
MVFAGVMEFETALRVVQRRGEAMQAAADAAPSGMVAVLGLERDQVQVVCDQARGEGVLQIANLLCPGNIVVSGDNAACERAAELAVAAGAFKVQPLAVAGAFHTPLMKSAVEKLAAALEGAKLSRPRIPVVSNVDAEPHDDPEEIRRLLIEQVVSPVLWEDSMRYLLAQGVDQMYEIGPGRVLRGLMRRIERKVPVEGVIE